MSRRDESERPDLLGGVRDPRVIPKLGAVPETKEEIRRRKVTRISTAIAIVVAIAIATYVGMALSHSLAIRDAAHAAGDDGRSASFNAAIALIAEETDPDHRALHARLLATQVLEANTSDTAEVTAILDALPQGQRSMNAVVASTFLALHADDLERAQAEAALITVGGEYAAEAAHARALVAVALGNPEAASAEAQLALEERPGAPRHAALLALIQSRMGDHAAGFATLDGATDHESSPCIRATRARLLLEAGEDRERAAEESEAVLGPLSSVALSPETAWAQLVRGWVAAGRGDSLAALSDARAAAEQRPPADEMFPVALAETFLEAGALDAAAETLDSVQPRTAHIRGRKAQIQAELALSRGNTEAARAALAEALPGTRSDVIRARLLETGDDTAEARALYAQAAEVPAFFVEASARLAALELAEDDAQGAWDLIAPVVERTPSHPQVVPIAVRARLALDDNAEAMTIVSRALEDHPTDPDLLAARAEVEIDNGDDEAALVSLRAAIERREDGPRLQLLRAQAARRVGEIAEARTAYDAFLTREPANPEALLAAAELAIEDADPDRAKLALDAIEEGPLRGEAIEYAWASYMVGSAAGQRGFRRVRVAMALMPRNAVLQNALGELFLQAEEYRAAANAFSAARNFEDGNPQAILGRTISQVRLGVLGLALQNLRAAGEAGASLGPTFEARILAYEGRVHMMERRYTAAAQSGQAAVAADPRSGEGHLLLADLASHRNEDSLPELRLAANGRIPQPEAMARVYLAEQDAEDACTNARGYLRAAPQGRFATRIRDLARRCPR
ncbi:MAG: tetratricopeptide repeat protein [Deltaproteobacteria bacterium]|nr:tetratricopeptide repeat protein [Deltaproteobacteria bacterium]